MPQFNYEARDVDGKIRRGMIEASSKDAAVRILRERQLTPISITAKEEIPVLRKEVRLFERIGPKDLVIFSRQLATMVEAELPILQALKILVRQTPNKKLAGVIQDIAYDVEGGESLSSALAKFPKVFNSYFINMVKSGETSGKVNDALMNVADYLEHAYDLNRKIKSALTYPVFVILAIVVTALVLLIYVLPQLTQIFEQANVALPWTTKLLIAIGKFFNEFWWAVLVVVAGIIIAIISYWRTEEGRVNIDSWKLQLPVFGPLFRYIYLARFAGNLRSLVMGEIPIITALNVSKDVIGNRIYEKIIADVALGVKSGVTISAGLEKHEEIPPMVSSMINVGERSGQLEGVLGSVNRFYEREVEKIVSTLTTLIEPVVIVILGVGVLFIAVSVIMPIYQLGLAIE